MTKEEKLLNMLMGDGASDGEIINARNMLKKMGVKLSIGGGNQDGYNKLAYEYEQLLSNYKQVNSNYEYLKDKYYSLYREYNNIMNQKMEVSEKDRYERQLKRLNKKLEDREVEMTKLSYYFNATFVLAVIFGLMFFGSLALRG